MSKSESTIRFPGTRDAMDGCTVAIACERESTDAAGAYPITPSTQMGEFWAEAAAAGHINISDRPLIFVEPEGEHAAAAVTAGMSMTGLRAANFSSGQGIAYMHESLYAAVGKRLTYVLNIGARAMTKASLNVHAGHDDYHCIEDTGFFQLFAKNAQEVADLNIISHRIAELSLNPGAIAQDGFLTTHLIESLLTPERDLIAEYLGRPDDIIECPTPAQKMIYGDTRRRVPEVWDVDNPVMAGVVQNQDSYMQSVAAQRPFFFDHIRALADQAFGEFFQLTGRQYGRVGSYRMEDADYVIVGQGSMVSSAEVVADYLRDTRGLKIGVVNMTMWRPFPGDLIGGLLRGRKGVAVLERLDQPLAVDLPMMREIRATIAKCVENGASGAAGNSLPHADHAVYSKITDTSPLYSGSFGMGSRDLQPEGLIATIENMLEDGRRQKLFYLSIDFVRDDPGTPKERTHQEQIIDAYPHVKDLSLHGSENPNLMPEGAITVRFHSVGGWGAITTGKNLAMTLFDLLGYHIKANPKYGSEKKGQPTTYYLSAAPEPIRVNCEYIYVDVVLSPDPKVLKHTNALAGLKEGGVFVIQSDHESAAGAWADIPKHYQDTIRDGKIRVFYIDGFKIAREEASDPELQLRMQGIAFQGAFFKASPVMGQAGFTEEKLFVAIEDQLQYKFGSKGARVVEDNLRVVRRGYDEIYEIPTEVIEARDTDSQIVQIEPLPDSLKRLPQGSAPTTDIHRFWEQTGHLYAKGLGNDVLADPFTSLSWMPAVSATFRNMTGIRYQHPAWIAENCTACGNCYTVCPDTAIPGLVNDIGDIFETAINRVRRSGTEVKHLPRAVRQMEGKLRDKITLGTNGKSADVTAALDEVIAETVGAADEATRAEMQQEFKALKAEIGDFQFSATRPYYTVHENKAKGTGGLFSITVNPYTCKGCMECVEVCDDDALRPVPQTEDSIQTLEKTWDFWMDLPTTKEKFIRVDDLEEGIGALETILLDKANYGSLASGDGACMGCSEKTVMHLFTATVEALMQPRIKKHVAYLGELVDKLEKHIRLRLVEKMDVSDTAAIDRVMAELKDSELTLAGVASQMESMKGTDPIDPDWFKKATGLLKRLKDLRWKYTDGITGQGRSRMGMLNSTGCTSVWGSTYPFNPYPFPWANHLFQDSPSVAMGVFEGHMSKMADGFRTIRMAELELEGKLQPELEDEFRRFDWNEFTDDEWHLCPPVVALGGDGAMFDIGFQNLSRLMMSGKPIKVVVVDTQVYSNTGGQACTSGFLGQVSDMAQYGQAQQGKQEIRKEMGLIGMAHRTTYILQSSMAYPSHMIEGFVNGLMARRPALFTLYTSCQPEHGIADDAGNRQAKMAVESRAFPLFKFDPDGGQTPVECLDLSMNPAMDDDWPMYELKYQEDGRDKTMEVPMTFVDFAVTEGRFRKHFRVAPPDTWNDNMVPLHEYLQLDADDRDGQLPFIWAVDRKSRLSRVLVAEPMVRSAQDRLDFWAVLKSLAGMDPNVESTGDVETRVRAEVMQNLTSNLMQLMSGGGDLSALPAQPVSGGALPAPSGNGTGGDYMAPWIDTPECTACDECTNLNGKMFAYNDEKKAYIQDPAGGPYTDLVKAAEKCTAQVIHPGLPADRSFKDSDKWVKRGEKHN
ncbi:MAG TPA: 2-oxoacid:acceptor oxidoreductase family protein [Candidatus Latescibacteria bacterium]|jgi:pyruvate-ferredoxin/flavodoxin oxidoreductase|nr:2-oxoacid:acceptor oxidoreductase family protein [Candidatus Latescibacterota bacterium]HJP30260.1 2-oxoacid:acceptor oxidoreductase family protein [Candidatus Latescibacterota bacterium]